MRVSSFLAAAALLGLVPVCLFAAYLGYRSGLYPYPAVPVAFGVAFTLAIAALFALLPVFRSRRGRVG